MLLSKMAAEIDSSDPDNNLNSSESDSDPFES